MRLSKYKNGLLSENPTQFYKTLLELHTDLQSEANIYGNIKKVNKFLCDVIANIDKSEIIENELYRIVPLKYSMIYALAIALQTEIEVAEIEIQSQKRNRTYTFAKSRGINPEKATEIVVIEGLIPLLLQIFESFTSDKMYGYDSIHEIEETIEKSNLVHALNRIHLLQKREDSSKSDLWKDGIPPIDDFDEHFSEMAVQRRNAIESFLEEDILKSKITILHIPLLHKEYPSIYIDKLNSVLVSEYMESNIKESRLFAEFGMYLQHQLTGDITKVPDGFKVKNKNPNPLAMANLFFDLFAYKVMEGTPLEHMHIVKNELKLYPAATREFLEDASYFDILVKE